MSNSETVVDVDADFLAGRHSTYQRLRDTAPVHKIRMPNGLCGWLVTGYEACRAILTDPRLHKSVDGISVRMQDQIGVPMSPQMRDTSSHMLNSDPPDHSRLRRLVGESFKPRKISALTTKIEKIAAELIDDMGGKEVVDLVTDYAIPLPLRTICELLGVPYSDRDRFREWVEQMHSVNSSPQERASGTESMRNYLSELVDVKRKNPGEDTLSELAAAHNSADKLTHAELVSMAHLLLVAGHETTAGLLGNALRILLQENELKVKILTDSTQLAGLIEEFLRFDGPIEFSTTRYTVQPVEVGRVTIPADAFVWVALGGANRDPAKFDDADRFRIRNSGEAHLAFGHGAHYCLGAPLARLEAEIALTAFIRRYPEASLVENEVLTFHGGGLMPSGLDSLPVRLV